MMRRLNLFKATTCSALILALAHQPGFASSLMPAEQVQPMPEAVNKRISQVAKPKQAPDGVELAALYYYAKQGQKERVDREIRRISVKFPDFVVPDDLFKAAEERRVDETSLWHLYERDDYTAIDDEISRLAAENPGWEPSADFQEKLSRRKQRFDITRAYKAQDWASVIASAHNLDPKTEAEADLLWMLIDAYSQNGLLDEASLVYQGMLFRDSDRRLSDDVLITTLQKAARDFPASELREVIRQLSKSPTIAARSQSLQLDLMRRELADYAAGMTGAAEPLPTTLVAIRRAAETSPNAKDQTLLGWYYLKANQRKEAESWFRRALSSAPSAEILKGLSLTLLQDDRKAEAFQVVADNLPLAAQDWPSFLPALSVGFSEKGGKAPTPQTVEAFANAIQAAQSADQAELLGWYAYNGLQFESAQAWFRKSFEWKPTPTALKGQLLTALQRKDKAAYSDLETQFGKDYAQVFTELKSAKAPSGLKGQTVAAPSEQAQPQYLISFKARRYGDCLADLNRKAATGNLDANAELIRGWCSLSLNRISEARSAFETAQRKGGGQGDDAAYGLGLTLLRAKLTTDAEQLLARGGLTPARDRELRSELLWQKARTAFDQKRYADALNALDTRLQLMPEAVGMTQMRAWAHYHLGNLSQAKAIFTALNEVVRDANNTRGITAIEERMGIWR